MLKFEKRTPFIFKRPGLALALNILLTLALFYGVYKAAVNEEFLSAETSIGFIFCLLSTVNTYCWYYLLTREVFD